MTLCRAIMTLVSASLLNAAFAQVPGFSIDLHQTNFEADVEHPLPETLVSATLQCNFDDWAKPINWGDGQTEYLTHTVQASLPGPTTPRGTWPLFSKHAYHSPGTFTATAQLLVHCSGAPPGKNLVDQKSYTVTVFGRLPLQEVILSSAVVKRGSTVDLTAKTFADAPPSATRVSLVFMTPGVFADAESNAYADIQPNSRMVTKTLTVLPTAPLGRATIRVVAGDEVVRTITVVK